MSMVRICRVDGAFMTIKISCCWGCVTWGKTIPSVLAWTSRGLRVFKDVLVFLEGVPHHIRFIQSEPLRVSVGEVDASRGAVGDL